MVWSEYEHGAKTFGDTASASAHRVSHTDAECASILQQVAEACDSHTQTTTAAQLLQLPGLAYELESVADAYFIKPRDKHIFYVLQAPCFY